ncbi:hypothetical protein ACGFIW_03990 [Micromonospora sp. NPDC048935]
MPGVPAADLVLVQTDLALRGLEALLNGPSDARDANELSEGGPAWAQQR